MTRYYIASGLENAEQVKRVKAKLDAAGWEHTYDWTVHGSVQKEGAERIAKVAAAEAEGVAAAEVVIVLLPGGRGTHTELGMALALREIDSDAEPRVCIYSPDAERDFGTGGTTCAFYHHPNVERFSGDLDEMISTLLGEIQ